ncbi:hypothetical protein P1J78_16490 [Psychromarinibacter sp. C21-152]|uniref:Uncharacterized protein n=1 Tax=Psychromarinibacter sediminicola TaxID=3033385 RepID=A0AAE3NVB9_9RHOB|nr:hypothetical protein [Psychromarinibacter sediminicola]MDF0602339.1 hypothetical protein [Psychromarinibacter sediminicola]
MTRVLAALALCLLAACSTVPRTAGGGDTALRPDAGGMAVAGSDQRIDFGRAEDGVIAAATRVLGAPPVSRAVNPECGAGPTTIVKYDRIDLLFLDGTFRGWVTDDPRTAAANGLSPGVTRAQLEAGGYGPFETTTLGVEFEANGVFGLLPDGAPDTPVQLLWAGTSCFFR